MWIVSRRMLNTVTISGVNKRINFIYFDFDYNDFTFNRCGACVEKTGKCAKCGVKLGSGEFVNLPGPGQSQIEKEEADFQRDLKCLPERRRRAFLRYLQKFNGWSHL